MNGLSFPFPRWALAACIWVLSAIPAWAQPTGEAFIGQPFGVAHLTLPAPSGTEDSLLAADALLLTERNHRIFYPAVATGRLAPLLNEFLGEGTAPGQGRLNVSFLFTGDEPLELTLGSRTAPIILHPVSARRPREFQRSLMKWWRAYHAVARAQLNEGDYPPLVQTYLTSMLGQRLGLEAPLLSRRQEADSNQLQQTLNLLMGTESLRTAIMQQTMRGGGGLRELASLPLPPSVDWKPLSLPATASGTPLESIASHVPEECFYIRFGSFENYLWLDRLKNDYGGDIGRMITLRGQDNQLDAKAQRQMALKQSALAEVLGPQIISDVALIGRDLYLREGAALGVLFEASNSTLLGANFTSERQAAQREFRDQGAQLETVSIAGRDVSFLHTPDNRLRSFYAVDGNYHLVTTSRAIVERFFAAGAGERPLSSSIDFQHARLQMPLSRDDTIFAFFSSAFFRGLLSPLYQIELTRRLQSVTDMELLELARLAALNEGHSAASIDELIASGFLPAGFGRRSGSPAPQLEETTWIDPQRGARGTFIPVPDVVIDSITPSEEALYQRCADLLRSRWTQMDPLLIGIKRYALPEERMERVVFDANVYPLAEEKYGWILSMVGPLTDVAIVSHPQDVVTVQMSLRGGLLWPSIPAHHLFLGLQDVEPALDRVPGGFLQTLRLLRTAPGYLGAWPQLGLLDLLPFRPPPDAAGFSPLPFGLWRWQGAGFSVLSFHYGVLADAASQLHTAPSENPAQIRIRVSDLAHSRLAGWISAMNYERTWQTSVGNVRLLHALTQQLGVPPAETLNLANTLLDTRLVCALGGNYELQSSGSGTPLWRSTAWNPEEGPIPEDYQAPILEWFRGAIVDLTKGGDRLDLHAEIDMQRKEHDPPARLPIFNLFGGNRQEKAPPKK